MTTIMGNNAVFISAILLAAGQSKRLKGSKLLLPLRNSAILKTSIDNLLSSKVEEVIVVLGHEAEEKRKYIDSSRAKIVINPNYLCGISSSLKAGITMSNVTASGTLIALADQPFVSAEIINRLITGFLTGGRGIVYPVYNARRGHPVIFSHKYRDELLKLEGDTGARGIIGEHPDDILEIKIDSPMIHFDIDTQEDYLASLSWEQNKSE